MNLENFKNIHQGKIGFIIGAGPSLHFENRSLMEGHVRFAVNSAIRAVPDAEYFLSTDVGIMGWDYFDKEIKAHKGMKLFQKERLDAAVPKLPGHDIFFYECHPDHQPHFDVKSREGYKMTYDHIIGSRTSAGAAVHFAWIMGCDPIVLVGCDACYVRDKRYFWQFDGWKDVEPIKNDRKVFSMPNSGKIKGKKVDRHCREFIYYWKKVATANENVNILNASNMSVLDVFPRKSLEDIINGSD